MTKLHFSGFILHCLLMIFVTQGFPDSWQLKNRVQIGCELDDNIYETPENHQREPSLRLLFQTRWERRERNSRVNFYGIVGYQGYSTEAREDKITDEWQLGIERRLSRRLIVGIDGWARFKHFLYDSIDYHLMTTSGFVRINLPRSWNVALSVQPQWQDYWASRNYDYWGGTFSFSLVKRFSRRLSTEATLAHTQLKFYRDAYWQPTPTDSLVLRGFNQRDRINKAGFQVRFYRGILLSFGYFYEHYRSNNYGFSYNRHRWLCAFSKKISRHLLLRLYGMLQKKSYREPLEPLIPLQPDPEKDESNFLIFDLSHSLTSKTALFLRLAWYNNESLFRTQYYRKQRFILGIESRF